MWHRVVLLIETDDERYGGPDNPGDWPWEPSAFDVKDLVLLSSHPLDETKPDPTRDEILSRIASDVQSDV